MQEAFKTLPYPEGYSLSYVFHYPRVFIYTASLLYFLSCLAFYIVWKFARNRFFPDITGLEVFWIVILAWPIVDILRASIQRGVGHLLGYNISFNIAHFAIRPETYTAEPGQFQKRGHALVIAVIPLSLILLLSFLLLIPLIDIRGILTFFLFVSIARMIGDFYFIWRFLPMPRKTLLYTLNPNEKLVFKPVIKR